MTDGPPTPSWSLVRALTTLTQMASHGSSRTRYYRPSIMPTMAIAASSTCASPAPQQQDGRTQAAAEFATTMLHKSGTTAGGSRTRSYLDAHDGRLPSCCDLYVIPYSIP